MALCAVSGAVVLAAGCGSSSSGMGSSGSNGAAKEPSASALEASAQQSVQKASSVHVDGHLSDNGAPVTVDLDVTRAGGMSGTVSQNGAPFSIISTDGKVYVKATQAFLNEMKAPSGSCALVCGKWLELSSQQASQLTGELGMKGLTGGLSQKANLTESGTTTVSGQSAYVLKDSQGNSVAVSTSSAHYPLKISTSKSPQQVIQYSQWNSVPKPAAPPSGQVLNLSQLK
jgi:hypothetical protein